MDDDEFEVRVDAGQPGLPAVVRASGELDAASAAEFGRALDAALDCGKGVALELEDLTFIDSSGLRVVTLGLRRARDEEQTFSLSSASTAVNRILDITGVGALLAP